ncbi:unnamed protein product [Cuscuta europaea]|uniref:ClpA/ClpB AAA lid domain-containing protein n=1 Tax=Cuscuta europaea TaxID=41803 RepID=A0A9P0Z7I4_CUSEU|nr:unnamed protein product [Cuscuta europaea]
MERYFRVQAIAERFKVDMAAKAMGDAADGWFQWWDFHKREDSWEALKEDLIRDFPPRHRQKTGRTEKQVSSRSPTTSSSLQVSHPEQDIAQSIKKTQMELTEPVIRQMNMKEEIKDVIKEKTGFEEITVNGFTGEKEQTTAYTWNPLQKTLTRRIHPEWFQKLIIQMISIKLVGTVLKFRDEDRKEWKEKGGYTSKPQQWNDEYSKYKYTYEAITAAVQLSPRDKSDRYLPDTSIDFIDKVGLMKSILKPDFKVDQLSVLDVEGCNVVFSAIQDSSDSVLRWTDESALGSNIEGHVHKIQEFGAVITFKNRETNMFLSILTEVHQEPVPEAHSVAARAIGSLIRERKEENFPDLGLWRLENLTSHGSTVVHNLFCIRLVVDSELSNLSNLKSASNSLMTPEVRVLEEFFEKEELIVASKCLKATATNETAHDISSAAATSVILEVQVLKLLIQQTARYWEGRGARMKKMLKVNKALSYHPP